MLSPPNRYVVALHGPALTTDCYALDEAAPDEGGTGQPVNAADAAMIVAGQHPVSWHVATWHQPDARTLRIALSADERPLTATIVFAIDPSSGLLSRQTVLRHRGIGPDVDITATLGLWCRIHEPVERMLHLAGAWAHETQVRRSEGAAALALESRAGKTGFDFQPYVALRSAASSYVCEIFWSGNWACGWRPPRTGRWCPAA